MSLFFIKNNIQIGNIPGSLDFIGEKKITDTTISIISYSKDDLNEEEHLKELDTSKLLETHTHWINVYGLHDAEKISQLCENFNIENLTVEDILNTSHFPKYEEYDNYKTFIIKSLFFEEDKKTIKLEQISIIILKNTIICFQEQPSGMYNKLRERIRLSKGKIRKFKVNYLLFAVLDILVENYINEVSKIGIEIEDVGNSIFSNNNKNIEETLYNLKTQTAHLRMQINPVKDLVVRMLKSENINIEKSAKPYFTDLIEMCTQANNNIELCNGMIIDQISTYNSIMSNKMNETMKVLTIFSSIFIPLTFLAGIYGMNFEHIPELKYKYSYPVFWLLIIIITIGLILFFKKRKWM